MRLALVLVAALLLAAPAAASGPPAKGLPFSFAAPKSGHAKVYGLVVTVKLPAGMTLSGPIAPMPQAKNSKALAKGTNAGSVVVPNGKGVWDIFVGIDARKAAGSGAAALTGTIALQGPLAGFASSAKPLSGNACAAALKEATGPNAQFWLIAGPDSVYKTVVTDAAKYCK